MDIIFVSDKDIRTCSEFSLNERFDLYDERFGSIKYTSKCTTCGKTEKTGCYGHYGSLHLGVDLFHPIFLAEISNAVNSICQFCRNSIPEDSKNSKLGCKCTSCGKTTYVDYNIFPKQSYIMKRRNGRQILTPTQCRNILQNLPEKNYIISYIIIPPTGIRPPETVEWPTDISRIYTRLVNTVKSSIGGPKYIKKVNSLYNSIVGYLRKDGFIKALSGKQGIFRTLMLGKRLNRSARMVIVGDPNLDIDEILIPEIVAYKLRIQERVWSGNEKVIKKYARENKLWWCSEDELALEDHVIMGKVYDRTLHDGDLVMFNRQPSLSKFSILAFKVRVGGTNNVFAFNPAVTSSFNADFDGDEMNIYAGYDLEAKAELLTLCYVTENIYDGEKVYVHPIQDVITGVYMATKWDTPITNQMYSSACIMLNKYPDKYLRKEYSSKDLISLTLPKDLSFRKEDINIVEGKYISGVITKDILCKDIILHIGKYCGNNRLAKFIKDIQLVIILWLDTRGFTLTLDNCMWKKEDILEYTNIVKNLSSNTLQDWVLYKSIHEYHTQDSTNPLSCMLRSGSKGKDIGAAQMAISLGQQYIGNNPIGKPITNGYIQGLTPEEYFSQASTSISGIIDIGTNVSSIGYANRRVSKLTADVVTNYNGIIGTTKQVVQFHKE